MAGSETDAPEMESGRAARRRPSGAVLTGLLATLLVLGSGCASSGSGETGTPSPQTMTPDGPTEAAFSDSPEAGEGKGSAREGMPQGDDKTPQRGNAPGTEPVLIESGGEGSGDTSLARIAARERERRRSAEDPVVVVDDENLAEHAVGKLTFTDAPAVAQGSPNDADDGEAIPPSETYWRRRVRDLRLDWRAAVERILELERRAADLRNRFYAEDDPYVRDGRIKPEWDRALAELEAAKQEAMDAEEDLEAALTEGRREGALPGWLRDGIELEPEVRPYETDEERPRVVGEPVEQTVIGEPVIVDEDREDPE